MFEDLIARFFDLKLWQMAVVALALLVIGQIVQTIYEGVYNIFFHPLRHFPGSFWDIALPVSRSIRIIGGEDTYTIVARHEQYGEVVRISPDTLSYIAPQAWKDIYNHSNDLPKTLAMIGFAQDSVIVAPKADHGRQRRAMAPAFSDKSLAQQELLIRVHVDLLVRRLRETNAEPTNAVRWFNLITFDIIGDLAFGHSLQGLEKNETNPWLENLQKIVQFLPYLALIQFSRVFGALLKVVAGPAMKATKAKQDAFVKKLLDDRLAKHDRGDFMDHLGGKLPEKELIANADLLMLAGTHTSALLLSGLTYWLASTPHAMAKVTKEVRDAFDDSNQITFQSTGQLPYLQAVIEEGLRIFPPAPLAMDRKTVIPTEICGRTVPPNTVLGVTHLAAYHSSLNFYEAKSFCPERWIEGKSDPKSPFFNDRRDVFQPFSYGPRDCVGQNLAYHEVRLILAKILWEFDFVLEKECAHWNKQKIYAMWELPELKVRYVRRWKEDAAA